MTCAEIAKELGISRERVRQLEKQALAKFRKGMLKHGYTLVELHPSGFARIVHSGARKRSASAGNSRTMAKLIGFLGF